MAELTGMHHDRGFIHIDTSAVIIHMRTRQTYCLCRSRSGSPTHAYTGGCVTSLWWISMCTSGTVSVCVIEFSVIFLSELHLHNNTQRHCWHSGRRQRRFFLFDTLWRSFSWFARKLRSGETSTHNTRVPYDCLQTKLRCSVLQAHTFRQSQTLPTLSGKSCAASCAQCIWVATAWHFAFLPFAAVSSSPSLCRPRRLRASVRFMKRKLVPQGFGALCKRSVNQVLCSR